jgi:hypothetical protein
MQVNYSLNAANIMLIKIEKNFYLFSQSQRKAIPSGLMLLLMHKIVIF